MNAANTSLLKDAEIKAIAIRLTLGMIQPDTKSGVELVPRRQSTRRSYSIESNG